MLLKQRIDSPGTRRKRFIPLVLKNRRFTGRTEREKSPQIDQGEIILTPHRTEQKSLKSRALKSQ